MSKMKFEDDFLFAKPVKSAYLEEIDQQVYWLNGSAAEHNAFYKLLADPKTRQQAFEKTVYALACDEKGNHKYKNNLMITDFHNHVDRALVRSYASLILGLTDGDDNPDVDDLVEEEVKK